MVTVQVVRLSEVARVLAGYAFASARYKSGGDRIGLLRGVNVSPGAVDWSDRASWAREMADGLDQYELAEGDIVVGMDRPWISTGFRSAVIRRQDLPALLVQRVARIRANQGVEQRYLAHLFRTPSFERHLRARHTETTVPHISHRDIESFQFLLPPLPEQRRIADILDKADAIRRKRKEAIALTEELLRSAFLDMFGDPVTNPKGWPTATIGELCERRASLVDGPFGSSLKPEHYAATGIRVVRNWNIYDDRFDASAFKFVTPEKFKEVRRSEVIAGDLLITTKGTVGDVCLMPDLDGRAVLSASGTVRLRLPPDGSLLGPVAVWQMILPTFKRYLHSFEAGSAQQYLNLSAIKKMRLILPPRRDQTAFADLRARVQALHERQAGGLVSADTLFSSLVHRAFTGSLSS